MSWEAFEEDKAFVTEALRRGSFDYLEVVGKVAETDFFRRLLGDGVLGRLAAEYPTPRQKEEVPLWLYLASELTLRLHGAMGFGAYPYVLHCGGLLDALDPARSQAKLDPASGQWRTAVEGFNHKNHYTRTTPCDPDFLRKLARDTPAAALEHWFGTAVVREYRTLGAFDPHGLFAVDGTYLFVPPDNDRYEGSSRLRFGPDGHPVTREQEAAMPPKRRRRCQWRRCYRAVTLSHITPERDYSLRCGTTVLPGKAAECPAVGPLVERFVGAAGPGVMKLLLYDRGLIDGKTVGRLKRLGVDSLFPLKHGMDLWTDAEALAAADPTPWARHVLPRPPAPPPPAERPEPVARREAARQKTLARQRKEAGPPAPARTLESIDYKWIEPSRVWETCDVPVNVLLVRHHYANGEDLAWALASTRLFDEPLDLWTTYRLRGDIEEDHRQEKCFWDMTRFRTTAFPLVVNRVLFVELASSLIQIFLRQIERGELAGASRQRLLDALLPQENKVALYYRQRFGHFTSYEYQELLLTLPEGARRRALGQTRRLRRAQLRPPDLPWRLP
ncbi:MAG TPA: transposase [Planctomycetota bacterium]|nr:transposase [Planctomycetota bacterium]